MKTKNLTKKVNIFFIWSNPLTYIYGIGFVLGLLLKCFSWAMFVFDIDIKNRKVQFFFIIISIGLGYIIYRWYHLIGLAIVVLLYGIITIALIIGSLLTYMIIKGR